MEAWSTEGVVNYTGGSLDSCNPRTVSLLKAHFLPEGNKSQGQLLKEDIISTLNFINGAKTTYQKMVAASIRLACSLSTASEDELRGLHHRWREVGLQHEIQKIKRESLKYNTELKRNFQHGTVDNSNIKHKLVRPEHFERGQTVKRPTVSKKPTSGAIVNRNKGVTSPWEGSLFKYEILGSLRKKLLKKMVLYGFRCYTRRCRAIRQCAVTCQRRKLERLMQLCFSTLLFEALSSRYIAFAAAQASQRYLLKQRVRPALFAFNAWVAKAHHRQQQFRKSENQHKRWLRRQGWCLLRWNARYNAVSRVRKRWSLKHSHEHRLLTAFTAWITSFVQKNEFRRQVFARLTRFGGVSGSNNDAGAVKTPVRSAGQLRGQNLPLSPLQVLSQEPLQNLRDAVTLFAAQVTRRTPQQYQRSDHFRDNGGDSPLGSEPGEASPHQNYRSLHIHTLSALKTLRSELENGDFTEAPVHSARSPHATQKHVGIVGTEKAVQHSAAVSPALRRTLQECVTARKLLPQPRFNVGGPDTGAHEDRHAGSGTRGVSAMFSSAAHLRYGGYHCADGSPLATSSGDLSSDADRILHSARKVSDAWLHRHERHGAAEGGQYLPAVRDPDTGYGLSEEMLLNSLPGGDYNSDSDIDPARQSPSANRLMERALNESFVLSPRIFRQSRTTEVSTPRVNVGGGRHSYDGGHGTPTSSSSGLWQGGRHSESPGGDENRAGEGLSWPRSPYFKRVSTAGAFCGEVEVDSDIELVLQDGARQSGADGRRGQGPVVDMPTQRRLLQRQFVSQIQGAFQLIKFRWLIRCCRRFVRTLHQQAVLHRRGYQCTRLHHRHLRRVCWQRWQRLLSKTVTAANLCGRIYGVKLSRRVLRAWHGQAIVRLQPAASAVAILVIRNVTRTTYRQWRSLQAQRRYQASVNATLRAGCRRRLFGVWKSYVGLLKQSRRIRSAMLKRVLRPIWQRWRRKYEQRTLLCRVFALQQQAWQWRRHSTPSTFQRLYVTYTAWRQYALASRQQKYEVALHNKAVLFRGASLMATHFYLWVWSTQRALRDRKQARIRLTIVKHSCFTTWVAYIQYVRHQVALMQKRVLVDAPRRRVLRAWRNVVYSHTVRLPTQHRRESLLRRGFDYLRTVRPLRRLQDIVLPLCDKHRLRASLLAWWGLKRRTDRYRHGLYRLNHAWLRAKYKQAYFTWPGRKEVLLARQMHDYLTRKHKLRIKLVDNPPPKQVVEFVSFVSKRRPTFAQRAINHGIIGSRAETDGVHYYQHLCQTILQMWQSVVRIDADLRMRAFMVRNALNERDLRRGMMKWVLLTPRTAYRRVVWMVKPDRRAHDDYAHKQELRREYSQLYRQSRSRTADGTYKVQVDESGHELALPPGEVVNRRAMRESKVDPEVEVGEYYSDPEEGEYVLQRRVVE